jgi:hypothetical protein
MILIYQNKHWSKERLEKQLLKEWRDGGDAAGRGENALLKYYLAQPVKKRNWIPAVIAA